MITAAPDLPQDSQQEQVLLDRRRPAGELAFPSPGWAVLRKASFRRNTFDAAAARAGLAGVTPHGPRHTAASPPSRPGRR